MLLGDGDPDRLTIRLNDEPIDVLDVIPAEDPARLYVRIARRLGPGTLTVETGDEQFTRRLAGLTASIDPHPTHRISPWIYGSAFPTDPGFVEEHGITVARWGGNATSLYNPDGDVTNAGADWFFENRRSDPADPWSGGAADQWLEDLSSQGVATLLSVPALDWVARDDDSYAFSVARYGQQQEVDPWQPDAGNGVTLGGQLITWNDPRDFATPWSPEHTRAWLRGLTIPPEIAVIDNELDICSETHRAIHPEPMGYDELLGRFIQTAGAVKDVLPTTLVAGPASCCWWFYWNSMIGADDKAAHGGEDLLPWFLDQLAYDEATTGRRLLDILDVHYYPEGVQGDRADFDTRRLRLASTRSLWDPTYWDQSWIGGDQYATQTQPDRNQVMLIPRFKALIGERYPGTRFAITEWNWGGEWDLSGGLAVADVLGIFGREGLDLATYWTQPPAGSPAAAGFALYRGAVPFGDRSLRVFSPQPDLLGVYAALDDDDRLTLVVVNKDPAQDLVLDVAGLRGGSARVRHFGGAAGAAILADAAQTLAETVIVPAYTAVMYTLDAPRDTASLENSAARSLSVGLVPWRLMGLGR